MLSLVYIIFIIFMHHLWRFLCSYHFVLFLLLFFSTCLPSFIHFLFPLSITQFNHYGRSHRRTVGRFEGDVGVQKSYYGVSPPFFRSFFSLFSWETSSECFFHSYHHILHPSHIHHHHHHTSSSQSQSSSSSSSSSIFFSSSPSPAGSVCRVCSAAGDSSSVRRVSLRTCTAPVPHSHASPPHSAAHAHTHTPVGTGWDGAVVECWVNDK